MAKISISLPDDLVLYVDEHVGNRSALIEKLLAQWKQDSENEELVKACAAVDGILNVRTQQLWIWKRLGCEF
jgi:metal-responsive CopG/Arc/MetJ family transcriptional regulator